MEEEERPGLAHGEDLTNCIIAAAMHLHRRLGLGLLESIYEACLCYELEKAAIPFRRQAPLPVVYDEVSLDRAYVADVIVAEQVIVEVKSVEHIRPLHQSQLLTYLRLTPCRIGLLLNFNTVMLKNGIKRCVL